MSRSPRAKSVDERAQQQCDLVRGHGRQLAKLDERHALARVALEAAQREERLELQRAHTRQIVDLWQQQGRTLGPWTVPVLEGQPARASEQKGKVGHG